MKKIDPTKVDAETAFELEAAFGQDFHDGKIVDLTDMLRKAAEEKQ